MDVTSQEQATLDNTSQEQATMDAQEQATLDAQEQATLDAQEQATLDITSQECPATSQVCSHSQCIHHMSISLIRTFTLLGY